MAEARMDPKVGEPPPRYVGYPRSSFVRPGLAALRVEAIGEAYFRSQALPPLAIVIGTILMARTADIALGSYWAISVLFSLTIVILTYRALVKFAFGTDRSPVLAVIGACIPVLNFWLWVWCAKFAPASIGLTPTIFAYSLSTAALSVYLRFSVRRELERFGLNAKHASAFRLNRDIRDVIENLNYLDAHPELPSVPFNLFSGEGPGDNESAGK